MNIVICTGGSGGHFYPALSLAQALKKRNTSAQITFIIGGSFNKARDTRFNYINIPAVGMPYKFGPGMFSFGIIFIFSFIKSLWIMGRVRPDIVVGFGGYGSAAAVFAAGLLKIPILIHEQNVVAGRANRFLSRFAGRICAGFPQTKKSFKKEAVFTGNPVREQFFKKTQGTKEEFGLDENKFTILVMGGSKGAHFINEAFLKMLSELDDSARKGLQVIHIAGDDDYGYVANGYSNAGINSRVFPFLENINSAYEFSDLVIARSGALTISEICYFQKPAILIPYPFGNGHQRDNARALAQSGAVIAVSQGDSTADKLKDEIYDLINDKEKIKRMKTAAQQFSVPDAAQRLVDEVEKLLNYVR